MISFNSYINFDDFDEFDLINQNDLTKIVVSQKYFSQSQRYIFKIFQFKCNSSADQKVILDTFYQVSKKKCQYIRCYNHLSFLFQSKLQPTFSMKYISTKTLEQVLRNLDLFKKLSVENITECLFAVAEGMSYLHSQLIIHGNLCPSNIIIDDANQFYVSDFGLYPIKKIYVKEENMFNKDYKDPYMKNNQPSFSSDVYSFGVLMCDIYIAHLKISQKMKQDETLRHFLKNTNKNKFVSFPSFLVNLITSCLNSFSSERPSFNRIIEIFKTTDQNIFGINVQQLYKEFITSDYLLNLAKKDDPNALNTIGRMYEKGKKCEKNLEKALEFYKKAAKLNHSEAQNNYGVLLQEINSKNKSDIIKGAEFLRLSAEQGNIYGMANYAIALLNGDGVAKNFQKAEEYLKKSADLGYSVAQLNYGNLLLDNGPSISAINEGLSYIKKAMNQNDSDAYFTYGNLLLNGNFIEKNNDLAMENFKIAADMGHREAILEYANGNLRCKNDKIALKYFQIAYENGDTKVKNTLDKLKRKLEYPNESINKAENISHKSLKNYNESSSSINNNKLLTKISDNLTKNKTTSNFSVNKIKDQFQYFDDSFSEDDNPNKIDRKSYQKNRKKINSRKVNLNENIYTRIIDKLNKNIPVKIGSKNTLLSLGKVVYDRFNYHSAKYIYPVGYQVEREYFSIDNPEENMIYKCSILDGGDSPIFRVECSDKNKKVFEGNSPSYPWMLVRKEVEKARGRNKDLVFSMSGPQYFGFTESIIAYLIENLPDAKCCINYKFKEYFPRSRENKSKQFNEENGKVEEDEEDQKDEEVEEDEEDEEDQKDEEDEEDEEDRKDEEVEEDEVVEYEEDKVEEDIENYEQNHNIKEKNKINSHDLVQPKDKLVNSLESTNLDKYTNLKQPIEKLIKQGDSFYVQNQLLKALECYKEVVNRGRKDFLLKCAETSETFEEKLEYLEQAIKENIPKSFNKWRLLIMRRISLSNDRENYYTFAKRFEENENFSDAAILYNKYQDKLNSQICYEKAKMNINNIKDGYQQYDFALFMINKKDIELAKMMLQKALANNVIKAEFKLQKIAQLKTEKEPNEVDSILQEGINYYKGTNGKQKNADKAMELFKKASELGCPKADYYIGYSNINENGFNHLKRSAKAGDPDGQNRYAHYLWHGILVKEKKRKALHYFRLAADQGHAEASFHYGKIKYEKGLNKEDKEEGIEYLKKSAEALFPDAIYMYSKICKETNPEDSEKFLKFAIEKGSQLALKDHK